MNYKDQISGVIMACSPLTPWDRGEIHSAFYSGSDNLRGLCVGGRLILKLILNKKCMRLECDLTAKYLILKMEGAGCSEPLVRTTWTTSRHIPGEGELNFQIQLAPVNTIMNLRVP
jgi:hypothetical protein